MDKTGVGSCHLADFGIRELGVQQPVTRQIFIYCNTALTKVLMKITK
jgi:hypothetical protein